MTRLALSALSVLSVLSIFSPQPGAAQIGGLIKKRVGQAAESTAPAPPSVGEPVAFDDAILELTPERIASVGEGMEAGRKAAAGPAGPAALLRKLDALDARQADLYEDHVEAINAWDEARRAAETCRDSVLSAATEAKQTDSPAEFLERNRQLGLDVARAQQRGDTAEVRRLMEKFQQGYQATRADSLAAERTCGVPEPRGPVKEWLDLQGEIAALRGELEAAEGRVRDARRRASGMDQRQLALACERIRLYLDRRDAKQQQCGFTQAELEALERARDDLKRMCEE